MGKFHVRGISLGVAFVFFMGIVAGSLHFSADEGMLSFAETFGLSIFVYALGLHVGPNFVCLMRNEGITLNLWGLAVIILGTVMALCLCLVLPVSVPDMVGILCGATTNTPALGAAQQEALAAAHLPSSGAALGCAVTYPLGVVGVIIAMIFIRKFFVKPSDLEPHRIGDDDQTFVGAVRRGEPRDSRTHHSTDFADDTPPFHRVAHLAKGQSDSADGQHTDIYQRQRARCDQPRRGAGNGHSLRRTWRKTEPRQDRLERHRLPQWKAA